MISARVYFDEENELGFGAIEILWSGFAPKNLMEDRHVFSLPQLVAENADQVREEILQMFEDFYDSVKSFPEGNVFEIEKGLNYWRMGFPGDLPLRQDSYVYEIARLNALFRLIEEERITNINLVSPDAFVVKTITKWADSAGVKVSVTNGIVGPTMRSIFRQKIEQHLMGLRRLVGAFRLLASHLVRYGLKFRYRVPISVQPGSDIWVSYLTNYQIEMSNRVIDSGFWGSLPSALELKRHPTNWLFIDISLESGPTLSKKRLDIKAATSTSPTASYFLIQDFMTIRALCKTLGVFFRLFRIGFKIQSKKFTLLLDRSKFDGFPLIEAYWQSLWSGSSAMMNAIWIGLFSEFFRHFSPKRGYILMENQAWERAFIHGARRKGKCDVLGFVHSQVRFWDLRYFHSSGKSARETWDTSSPNATIVGSSRDKQLLTQGGVAEHLIISAEALRFCSGDTGKPRAAEKPRKQQGSPLSVLVLGDYDDDYNKQLLKFANQFKSHLSDRVSIMFRPHPSSISNIASLGLAVGISREVRIDDALANCDLVICGHLSAARLNAELHGKPVVAIPNSRYLCDQETIGNKDLASMSIGEEVDEELWLSMASRQPPHQSRLHLNVDSNIPKWLSLVLHGNDL